MIARTSWAWEVGPQVPTSLRPQLAVQLRQHGFHTDRLTPTGIRGRRGEQFQLLTPGGCRASAGPDGRLALGHKVMRRAEFDLASLVLRLGVGVTQRHVAGLAPWPDGVVAQVLRQLAADPAARDGAATAA